ncbi:peptidase M23 [Streptomyces nanshensis]|uniref:Peptidase M23 n=2 Tax=Streptomyces nanshensis TaxID=518642 RepID=A0A1E7LAF8_9ACTN|nr:peptidoglycan DD-metalloendopeptidase family protein [Streptomyces nanshensis]OEV13232.1 peptidase M23 [Streptomyces nanshensis]
MFADDHAEAAPAPAGGALRGGKGGVPGRYKDLIYDAAECKNGQRLPAPVLAAQLRQESGFNPRAGSDKGAQGIAQFVPGTWASRGIDGDGDGDRDVWDPKDAIPAQGAFMCSLLTMAKKHPQYDGSPTELALAGYNAGWGAVAKYGGVPPYRETQNYVRAITAGAKDLTAADVGGSAGTGTWVRPVDAKLGTPYHASGAAWSSGYHTGVDFAAASGTTVRAVGPGRVVAAGDGGAYGNQIVIRHSDGMHSQYGHLSAVTVRPGQTVRGGAAIGRSGQTGNAYGPHLHFEIRTTAAYGSDIAPLPYLRKHGLQIG